MLDLMQHVEVRCGDVRRELRKLPDACADAVVTSPPYWRLRDYGFKGQLGLEPTPQQYIRNQVKVFREVRRVLRPDGTIWLNIGDSYAGSWGGTSHTQYTLSAIQRNNKGSQTITKDIATTNPRAYGLKAKDLIGIPWRLALALQADGWYLRQDIVWHKPNGMPSSVVDRCTTNHEYIFLLSKSARYHFDQAAIKEPAESDPAASRNRWDRGAEAPPGQKPQKRTGRSGNIERVYGVNAKNPGLGRNVPWEGSMRNRRSVWSVATDAYGEEHFAVFPPKLIEPCILAGVPPGGTVLDIYGGTGTTAGVAVAHGRKAILIEGNPQYVHLIPHRVEQVVRRLHKAPAPAPQPDNQTVLF